MVHPLPCEAEDEVAGLPDVDVVLGDVVQEDQRLPARQRRQIVVGQVYKVILPPGLLYQDSHQPHHLV